MAKPDAGQLEPKGLNFYIDAHHCQITDAERDQMRAGIEALSRQVENFPVSDLRAVVEWRDRNNEFAVKLTLILTGETLVASEHDIGLQVAFEKCVDALAENVRAYKDRMGRLEERQKHEKGTLFEVEPSADPDPNELEAAVRGGEYARFRTAMYPYEDGVRLRVGRWVERYPEVQAALGNGVKMGDIVEDVFLTAFEQYDRRPLDERFGEWLGKIIDVAVKEFRDHPDEAAENVRLAQSGMDAERGQGAS